MIESDTDGVKAGRRLAVETDRRRGKRMPGATLARLVGLDAGSLKNLHGTGNAGIEVPITT